MCTILSSLKIADEIGKRIRTMAGTGDVRQTPGTNHSLRIRVTMAMPGVVVVNMVLTVMMMTMKVTPTWIATKIVPLEDMVILTWETWLHPY